MKKLLAVLLTLTMLLGVSALAEESAPLFQQDVMILFTSDVHCGIESNFGYAVWPWFGTLTKTRATMCCWWTTATPSRASLWAP